MATLDELSESTEVTETDIMHLRRTSGTDFKITGENLRDTFGGQTITVSTTQTIDLSTYFSNLNVIVDTAGVVLTFSNKLKAGFNLLAVTLVSGSSSIIVGGDTYTFGDYSSRGFLSDGTNMIESLYTSSRPSYDTVSATQMYVSEDLDVDINLNVDGAAVIDGDLDVGTDLDIQGNLTLTDSPTEGSQVISSGATWTVPKGIYMVKGINPDFEVQVYISSAWRSSSDSSSLGFLIYSSGSDTRIYNSDSADPKTVYYKKY